MNRAQIGAALDSLKEDVQRHVLDLVAQYHQYGQVGVLKQAVDTPHRARAQVSAWIAKYESSHGTGTANAFLASCLAAASSTKTLANVNQELIALENLGQQCVALRQGGASWDEVADACEQSFAVTPAEDLSYDKLPIPPGYTTVWGEPW